MGAEDLVRWQEFVDARPDAGAHHHAAWYNVLTDCCHVKLEYWWARDDHGRVVGVLPMFVSRSRFVGPHLSTLEGGALTTDRTVADALYNSAARLASEQRLGYTLVRGGASVSLRADSEMELKRAIVDLDHDPGAVERTWSSDLRNHIRKAAKRGLTAARDEGALRDFYAIYARRMHELGTPVEGFSYFQSMARRFGSHFRLHVVRSRERVIAGMVCLENRASWSYLYGAADSRHFPDYPMEAAFAFTIREASANGVAHLDLGTSAPGTGAQRFKDKWATRSEIVRYRYLASPGETTRRGMQRYRKGRTTEQRLWSRLPARLARAWGPVLRRALPFA